MNNTPLEVTKIAFTRLTDEERVEVMASYCKYCGCDDPLCQC